MDSGRFKATELFFSVSTGQFIVGCKYEAPVLKCGQHTAPTFEKAMTADDLVSLKDQLTAALADIKVQIKNSKAEAKKKEAQARKGKAQVEKRKKKA